VLLQSGSPEQFTVYEDGFTAEAYSASARLGWYLNFERDSDISPTEWGQYYFGEGFEIGEPPAWVYLPPTPSEEVIFVNSHSVAFGWPLQCLYGTTALTETADKKQRTSADTIRFRLGRRVVLPVGVLWGPLVVNVAVYWAFLTALVLVPGLVRRSFRHRNGRCPRCAYGLAGDFALGCPECGWNRAADPA